jgi:hypothetical protein
MSFRETVTPELFSLQERRQILLAEYQEVCKSHTGITDFRAKLLALLPIASGAGVGLLVVQGQAELSTTQAGLLVALGIFGAVVTVGLFLYELRQVDICKQLRNHATWIEKQLGIEAGQFGGRRRHLNLREAYVPSAHRARDEKLKKPERSGRLPEPGSSAPKHYAEDSPKADCTSDCGATEPGLFQKPFIGAEAAGYLVYHAVICAWLFVLGFGIVELI